VRGIEHDEPGEFMSGRGRDDLPAKAASGQKRQPPAMIEVGMRLQDKIDARRIKAKVTGIFLGDLAAALIEPTIDQNAPACTGYEVTRTRHVAVGPMK